uniref:NADH-ubiquinone oxidoreductase chain 6 n=2 Tax=Anthonomus rectirostris TaxID=1341944 RepID=A0A5B9XVA8_9CUCU|nr:NADH dehydrogenase subunit 6 [Anthonomus rectirostris]QEH58482.1 NADH dehydrogenase subunit 6 [Anthonomus rectirostris]
MSLLILNSMFSIMFMFMNHPLSLGCVLLAQTILASLFSSIFYFNYWFSYIIFLAMVGGMLVMFIYMTSLASNEKFLMPKFMLIFSMLMLMILSMNLIFMDGFYSFLMSSFMMNYSQTMNFNNLTLNKYFNYPYMHMMIFLMFYLFITLIAVVKIIDKNLGTLRQK